MFHIQKRTFYTAIKQWTNGWNGLFSKKSFTASNQNNIKTLEGFVNELVFEHKNETLFASKIPHDYWDLKHNELIHNQRTIIAYQETMLELEILKITDKNKMSQDELDHHINLMLDETKFSKDVCDQFNDTIYVKNLINNTIDSHMKKYYLNDHNFKICASNTLANKISKNIVHQYLDAKKDKDKNLYRHFIQMLREIHPIERKQPKLHNKEYETIWINEKINDYMKDNCIHDSTDFKNYSLNILSTIRDLLYNHFTDINMIDLDINDYIDMRLNNTDLNEHYNKMMKHASNSNLDNLIVEQISHTDILNRVLNHIIDEYTRKNINNEDFTKKFKAYVTNTIYKKIDETVIQQKQAHDAKIAEYH